MSVSFVFQSDNVFERTILYAISLGGDTDTVATMAGAMAGGYYGLDIIPSWWRDSCEGVQKAMEQADELFSISQKCSGNSDTVSVNDDTDRASADTTNKQ